MNISVNITPNKPNPKLNPILSSFLPNMRLYVIPNLFPVKFCHKGAGIAFAGNICITAGIKVCVKLVIRLITGIT